MSKGLFLLCLFALVQACGKSSVIKSDVAARRLGDGENYTQALVVPLSDKTIEQFDSNLEGMNVLVKGIMGTVMNLGANIGAGKTRLTLTQPIPEIDSDTLSSIKITRLFFYIEELTSQPGAKSEPQEKDFGFLRRLALKVSSTNMERENDSWAPIMQTGSFDAEDTSIWNSFTKKGKERAANINADKWDNETNGYLMVKYHQNEEKESLQGKNVGPVYIVQTKYPLATRKYLQENYSKYVTFVHSLNQSILVQLRKDKISEEMFKLKLSRDSHILDQLGIGEIKPWTKDVCLDFKVPNINLMGLIRKGNALKIDTLIDPKANPKAFQLKGFLEFEIKVKTKI